MIDCVPDRGTPADEEREKTYNLAENVNRQLDIMSKELADTIKEINDSRRPSRQDGGNGGEDDGTGFGEDENPVSAIVRILGEHLSSLEWLDGSTAELEQKVQELSKVAQEAKNDADRVHRGAISSGLQGGTYGGAGPSFGSSLFRTGR